MSGEAVLLSLGGNSTGLLWVSFLPVNLLPPVLFSSHLLNSFPLTSFLYSLFSLFPLFPQVHSLVYFSRTGPGICVIMYPCVYASMCIWVYAICDMHHVYMHFCAYASVTMFLGVYASLCRCTCMHTHHVYMYPCVYASTCICISVYVSACICIHMIMYT